MSCFMVILSFLATEQTAATNLGQPLKEGVDSPFVLRMLSLDRDRDGKLSGRELPGRMAETLKTADRNGDGLLDREELRQHEAVVEELRTAGAKGKGHSGTRNSTGPQTRTGRRRGAGNRIRPANGIPGARLTPEQILRFALTFDADHDGGLNGAELKAYAVALAKRRQHNAAQAAAASGVSDGAQAHENDPKSRPPGLERDGRGDGGFGDTPEKPKSNPFD